MGERTTIYDLAEYTGLSTATIHRALNGQGRVSIKTRELVLEAAKKLDYRPNTLARRLSSRPAKIAVVCENVLPEFYDAVCRGAERAFEELRDYNVIGSCVRLDMADEESFREGMMKLADAGMDGIVLSAAQEDVMACRLVDEMSAKGIAVATIISDLKARRAFCIRSDGFTSGKTAFELLEWMVGGEGEVAMFTRRKDACIHRELISGVESMAQQSTLKLVGIYENNDDPQTAYHAIDTLFTEHPHVKGIYVASANALTVIKRLEEMGLAGKIRLIVSDLFPEFSEYFEKKIIDATIFQDPFTQAKRCVHRMYRYLVEDVRYEDVTLVQSVPVMRSNMQAYLKKVYGEKNIREEI